ncbi:MAG: methylenetetrahydrofolate reductase [NAD(P)H] [Acidimicrobiia bacterium]|nr:methylenetetrahydrofolate reductase [NAD(P)H] [Acidimicrobiia bacterium]
MFIRDRIDQAGRSFSFEFFPPKTPEGEEQLWQVLTEDLAPLHPTFVSVTFGAGGSRRDHTIRLTERIGRETDLLPMAHLTTVGTTRAEIDGIVTQLHAAGVRNILALRGDPPRDQPDFVPPPGGLEHAVDLVRLIRDRDGDEFCVGVAGFPEKHPDAPDFETGVRHLVEKVKAGADFVLTQFFFEAVHYRRLVETAAELGLPEDVPVIPGIMPVTNLSSITRMAELSGTDFPAWLADRLGAAEAGGGSDAVWEAGVEEATRLCEDLLDAGAPGLHFYTLNRSPATRQIYVNLGLAPG